jgi:hypothetical protein
MQNVIGQMFEQTVRLEAIKGRCEGGIRSSDYWQLASSRRMDFNLHLGGEQAIDRG